MNKLKTIITAALLAATYASNLIAQTTDSISSTAGTALNTTGPGDTDTMHNYWIAIIAAVIVALVIGGIIMKKRKKNAAETGLDGDINNQASGLDPF